ncbi:MAG: hypothetical protein AB7L84_00310 [Acidimicrobiia bacterium]
MPRQRSGAKSQGRPGTTAAEPTGDWPAQAADTIERLVGTVRDKTTGPAIKVARVAVYGLFAGVVGLAVAILSAIAAVRFVDAYLPDAWFGERHTWAAHLLVGLVFTIGGMVLWSRRKAPGNTP